MFDHIDLRVRSLDHVRRFYEVLLPALGFTRQAVIEGWLQFEAASVDGRPQFVGVTESSTHLPNDCRVAFRAESPQDVERLAAVVRQAGGLNIEGPLYEGPGYYAVFFNDPSGNRLEICHREGESGQGNEGTRSTRTAL
jgi:predicted enzyme related to lactoylglutathione lyase